MNFKVCVLAMCLSAGFLQAQQPTDKASLDRWMQELSNWGRWGKDDQMGTVNHITDAKRKAAAALVKTGQTVSLSRAADKVKSADNGTPFGHEMIATGSDPDPMFGMDIYSIRYHGLSLTHLDSLSHMFYQGKMYNGYPQTEVNKQGAQNLAVTAFQNSLVSRGVLLDIPRLKGVKYLEVSTPISPADLEAWEKKAGIKVVKGDIVFVRTGRWARRAEKGPWSTGDAAAGLNLDSIKWLRQREAAMVGCDNNCELVPSTVQGSPYPVHQLLIIAMGMPMFDNCDLETLGEVAAKHRRWEFFFVSAPLVVPGGTGSPVNPIAIF